MTCDARPTNYFPAPSLTSQYFMTLKVRSIPSMLFLPSSITVLMIAYSKIKNMYFGYLETTLNI